MNDDLLRITVRDLAAESGTPADLTTGALARVRRARRIRRATTVAVVVAAVAAAAVVPFTVFRDATPAASGPVATGSAQGTGPAPVTPGRFRPEETFVALGGTRLLGYREGATSFVHDPDRGGYRGLPTAIVTSVPSPDGRYAAVFRAGPGRWEILDVRADRYRELPFTTPLPVVWSADGTHLLVTHDDGFSVVRAATAKTERHVVETQQRRCLDYCLFTWLPGGAEVALPQASARNSEPARVDGLAVFAARSGKLLRNVPVKGAPTGQDAWSPDRRQVLVHSTPGNDGRISMVDLGTRQQVAGFAAESARFLADGTVLARRKNTLTRYDASGHPMHEMTLPDRLGGLSPVFGR